MILVIGPLFSGKQEYICQALHWDEAQFRLRGVRDVQELAGESPDLEELADELAAREVVLFTETGGGVVPTDAAQRRDREAAGRLGCLLAARAQTVIRVCCGLPQILKGKLP